MESKCKRLLFVLPSGNIGGTRTALVNLISGMDKARYDIDVLLIQRHGPIVKQFEPICNLLGQDKLLKAGRGSGTALIKSFDLIGLARRVYLSVKARLEKVDRYDMVYKMAAKQYSNKYDCVIAYQEKDATYFTQYIDAPRKIAWVHSAYFGYAEQQRAVYDRFDKVVFVSNGIMQGYVNAGAVSREHSIRIYNNFDMDKPRRLGDEFTVDRKFSNCPMLVSVGRCVKEKRFDRIIKVAQRLKADTVDFEWYVVGGGALYDELCTAAQQAEVDDRVFFIGQKPNPYPYIKQADLVVMSSITEAFPIICGEAAALKKPIVATDYPAAHEIVDDGKTGIICPNSSDGVYQGVKQMLDNHQLRQDICNYLATYEYDNQAILDSIYSLIDGE